MYESTVHISVVPLCTYCILQTKRSYKDGIVAILHIQNSIILIQTTEDNNLMLE